MPYTAADVLARDPHLRMLLCAPPKAGKTTCAVTTSPAPVFVFNTDGKGALDPVALRGFDQFAAEDITGFQSFGRALGWFNAHSQDFQTVVLDNISGLADMLEVEVRRELQSNDARHVYPELYRRVMKIFRDLVALPHHVIVIGHVEADTSVAGSFGHILSVGGKSKLRIPSMIQDWVWLQVDYNPETELVTRDFLLAPQGSWTKGVRSIKDIPRMTADITKFIELVEQKGSHVKKQASTTKPVVPARPPTKPNPPSPAKPQQPIRPNTNGQRK